MSEQRETKRISVKQKPKGNLRLIVEDESRKVHWIGDVSPFGINVQVKKCVDVNTDVGLICTIDNINFEILGTVKWVRTYTDENCENASYCCEVGIFFWPRNVKENLDFFHILSKP